MIPKSWRNWEGPLLISVCGERRYTRRDARPVSYMVVAIACFGMISFAISARMNLEGVAATFQRLSKAFHFLLGSDIFAPISFVISTRSHAYWSKTSLNCFFCLTGSLIHPAFVNSAQYFSPMSSHFSTSLKSFLPSSSFVFPASRIPPAFSFPVAATHATVPMPIFPSNSAHFLLEFPEPILKIHARIAHTASITFVIFPLQLSAAFESSTPACTIFPVSNA